MARGGRGGCDAVAGTAAVVGRVKDVCLTDCADDTACKCITYNNFTLHTTKSNTAEITSFNTTNADLHNWFDITPS